MFIYLCVCCVSERGDGMSPCVCAEARRQQGMFPLLLSAYTFEAGSFLEPVFSLRLEDGKHQ